MPTQKVKSGYKLVEWLFRKQIEIPEHWNRYQLKEILSKVIGGTPLKPEDFVEEGFPVLHKGDIQPNNVIEISDINPFCSNKFAQDYKDHIIDNSYMVVTLRDLVPSGPTIGLIAQSDGTYLLAQGAYGFTANEEKFNPNFIIQLSNSPIYKNYIKSLSVGSTQIHVRTPVFLKMQFWLPPILEQNKIAEILTKVDNLINASKKIIEETKKLEVGLTQLLFSQGLGHTELKQVKLCNLLNSKYVSIPKKWNVKLLSKLVDINPEKIEKNYEFDKICYIDISAIQDYQIKKYQEFSLNERPSRAQRIVRKNDIIISTVRPYLKAFAIVNDLRKNLVCSTGFAVLRPKDPEALDFIFSYLKSNHFLVNITRYMQGISYPAVTSKDIKKSPIPISNDITEIKKIGYIFSSINSLIKKEQNRLQWLELLKKGLLQKIFTGKICVKL